MVLLYILIGISILLGVICLIIPKEIREKMFSNLKVTDIVSLILTAFLVIATIVYVDLTNKILNTNNNQIVLSHDPVVEIENKEIEDQKDCKTELIIENKGISDVIDVELYVDYFLSNTTKENITSVQYVGTLNILPKEKVSMIKSGQSVAITVDYKKQRDIMVNIVNSSKDKGIQYKLMKIQIDYRRKLDSKLFSYSKLCIIADPGIIFDPNFRGMDFPEIPISEIKSILNVK